MSIARDVTTVGAATLMSRLLGFLRDAGIAAVLGAGVLSDAYFTALQISNLFRRLLAEGALNSAYVPMAMRIREENGAVAARQFGEAVLGAMAAALVAVGGIVPDIRAGHRASPGARLSPGRRALSAGRDLRPPFGTLCGVVRHRRGRGVGAQRPWPGRGRGLWARGVQPRAGRRRRRARPLRRASVAAGRRGAVGGHRDGGLCATRLRRGGMAAPRHAAPAHFPGLSPVARRFFVRAIPGVVAGGIPQLKLMAGAMVASSSQAAVSWLYYANRLYELPLGVISIAISAVLVPAIAASLRSRNGDHGAQSRAFEIALALALPSTVAFAVLAQEISGGLFERGAFGPRDTAMVAAALAAISAGLPGHSLEKVLGAVSFAHEDTRTPMYTALCGLAAAVAGSLALFPRYGHVGVAGAIALSGWVGVTLLGIILWRRGWLRIETAALRRLPRLLLAAAIMGCFIAAGNALATARLDLAGSSAVRIASLGVLVATGLGVYLLALQAFGVTSLAILRKALQKRL